jgi:energy-coupling factor transport system ATP-binding protein
MLDPRGRREVVDTIRRLNRESGLTVVLITHHMSEAARADRVVVMDSGRIIADGTPKEVFSRVELLESVGLEVPQSTRLIYELKKAGLPLPDGCIGTEACVSALEGLWKETADGTIKA